MLWHGGLCGCLPIFALVSDRPECKRVSSSPAVNFSRSLSFTRLSPHGIPCQRERRVRWVCGRTGQRLREMTGSVIRAARGVPYRGGGGGAVYNVIPQQLLQSWPWAVSAYGFMALSPPSVTPLMAWCARLATFPPATPVAPPAAHTHVEELSHMVLSELRCASSSSGSVLRDCWGA